MDREIFKAELNKELKDLTTQEIIKLINELVDKLSSSDYEYLLCKIKHFKGEDFKLDNSTIKEYNNILSDFEEIKNGEICFKSYSYETGTYSYYDADVDYVYYPSYEIKKVLINTYELIKKMVLYSEYEKAITLFESIIYTNYTCEEVGNPEYDDSDEVYDIYEVDFNNIKNNLGIDLNNACLYAIYSITMLNKSDKFEKICNYYKVCPDINIKDIKNIGIEEIDDFDKFYTELTKYLDKKI